MKKNNKGFTLVELLAVIVILAIIALIATPIILNIIENARKDAAKDSAYGYVEAAKLNYATTMTGSSAVTHWGEKAQYDGDEDASITRTTLKVSGTEATAYKLDMDATSGQISGSVTVNGYTCTITNGVIADSNGCQKAA